MVKVNALIVVLITLLISQGHHASSSIQGLSVQLEIKTMYRTMKE